MHDLHSQLHSLQKRYNELNTEHAKCIIRDKKEKDEADFGRRAVEGIKNGMAEMIRGMDRDERIKLLGLVAECEFSP